LSTAPPNFFVSIDPSSTCTGIAYWRGGKLVAFDLVKAKQSKKIAPHDRAIRFGEVIRSRVNDQIGEASAAFAVEVPGGQGKMHSRGLVTLGLAVGAIAATLMTRGEVELIPVTKWSRLFGGKCISKDARADLVAEMFPAYDRAADKGLDIADAIGLGAWRLGLFRA